MLNNVISKYAYRITLFLILFKLINIQYILTYNIFLIILYKIYNLY